MANLYPPEIAAMDQIYQKEPTVLNELNLEKAKLALYGKQLEQNPGDKEMENRVRLHEAEVVRAEAAENRLQVASVPRQCPGEITSAVMPAAVSAAWSTAACGVGTCGAGTTVTR